MSPHYHNYYWVFTVLVGAVLCGCGMPHHIPEGVYAAPAVCDLGTVTDTETIVGEFKIVNTSTHTVNIRSVKLSCGCSDFSLIRNAVPANDFVAGKLTVVLKGKYGPSVFEALVLTDDPTTPAIQLLLKANVAVKELDGTTSLNLGLFHPEDHFEQAFTILPGRIQSVAVVSVTPSTSDITNIDVSATPLQSSDNQAVQLTVRGIVPSQTGEFFVDMKLVADGADWGEAPVRIQGTVKPAITIPNAIFVGFVEPEQSQRIVVDVVWLGLSSQYVVDKMTVVNEVPDGLCVRYVNTPKPQLEISLRHPGVAGSFSQTLEMDFWFSSGKINRLSTNVIARFL